MVGQRVRMGVGWRGGEVESFGRGLDNALNEGTKSSHSRKSYHLPLKILFKTGGIEVWMVVNDSPIILVKSL